ncbi:MAG: FtsX-like permease family protein [Gammaproteobacteria bacterium]|nr:FtsX-like permease family protein [Gammaproteobacteria bacterium]
MRRIGAYAASVALGVAALVAVHSFSADVIRSIREESQLLLGADLRLTSNAPISDSVGSIADSVVTEGGRLSRVTGLVSMVYAPGNGATRLTQVRGVEGGFPLYGRVETTPPGIWSRLGEPGIAIVDEAIPIQLGVGAGDTLQVGTSSFVILGTVRGLPTDIGFQSAIGPRVFVARSELAASGLLEFGSVARHHIYLRMPAGEDPEDVEDRHWRFFRNQAVTSVTAQDQARRLTRGTRVLAWFLRVVGLTALLLGGIGAASAIHVYVKEKTTAVAVLRCIGARERSVFNAYLLQAVALGLVGSVAGVAGGIGLQRLLPLLITDVLPVTVEARVDRAAVVAGLATGMAAAALFALLPLLRIRGIAPLQALRADFEPEATARSRLDRVFAFGALVGGMLLLSLWQAPEPEHGLAFAGGLSAALLLLYGTAVALTRLTRRYFPARASYAVRQGVANLFRPQNQTAAVMLALGLGAFLITTVLAVQASLGRALSVDGGQDQPNLLFFDVQPDQRDGVTELVAEAGGGPVDLTPVVPARISSLNGRPAAEILRDRRDGGPARWAVRRLYRNTSRAELSDSEELVAGRWWGAAGDRDNGGDPPDGVSLDADLADDLRVGIGDRITWDVQGVPVTTTVQNLRRVDWERFDINFLVVAEPGVFDQAPRSYLGLARIVDPQARARMQRNLVLSLPNVSVLDLALIQEALDTILGRVGGAIRFLALFIALAGVVVLVGSLSTSRYQRMRESALLKTLGARRSLVRQVLLAEYTSLGVLAGLTGALLGVCSAWALVEFFFEMDFHLPVGRVAGVWLVVVALTVVTGFANSRGVLRRTPLETLRAVVE